MHLVMRIGGVFAGVLAGSAVLAVVLHHMLITLGVLTSLSGVSVFVGLLTAGLVGAVLTKDSWLGF